MMHPLVNRVLKLARKRTDLVFAWFMLLAVLMIVMPLPSALVDVLIGINIALTMLLLIVAFYARRAVDFSTLPSFILVSTLFRIALSITTTRLILRDADAGRIVEAFGELVIGGEVVIGMVIFLVITVAQFVVITKGAERVAEVAARFSLDAMPGKQMSIDNDLRNGDIDQAEARLQRKVLEQESQLFGAMDGAMKFVKGDAIASLVILAVNLLGGLAVGVGSRGMSLADAGHTYAILSIGDGLVAQIPSLLTALGAGLIVTRVASVHQRDLGAEIVDQLTSNDRALWLTFTVLILLALIPGFPLMTFAGLAAAVGGIAFFRRRNSAASSSSVQTSLAELEPRENPVEHRLDFVSGKDRPVRVRVHLGVACRAHLVRGQWEVLANRLHADMESDLGIVLPGIAWADLTGGDDAGYGVAIDGIPVASGSLPPGCVRLREYDQALADLEQWEIHTGSPMRRDRPTYWVEATQADRAESLGMAIERPDTAVLGFLRRILERHASEFIGLQEVTGWLQRSAVAYPDLVNEAQRIITPQRLAVVLRDLLDGGASLAHSRALLEAVVEWGPRHGDPLELGDHLRQSVARQICHRHADTAGVIHGFVFDRRFERSLRTAFPNNGTEVGLPPASVAAPMLDILRDHLGKLGESFPAVIVTSADLRRGVQRWLRDNGIDEHVLAFSDISRGYCVHPIAKLAIVTEGAAAA
jgi:type III secretion protein V